MKINDKLTKEKSNIIRCCFTKRFSSEFSNVVSFLTPDIYKMKIQWGHTQVDKT